MKVLAEHEITDYKERLDLYDAQERKRLEDSGAIRPQRTGGIFGARTAAGNHVTGAIPYGYLHDPQAEQIRKSVYGILRQEQREQQTHRAQDMEL